MNKWSIGLHGKDIIVSGNTLQSAVKNWSKRQRNGTTVSCGLLVRVLQLNKKTKVWKYWSGEEFMRCLD